MLRSSNGSNVTPDLVMLCHTMWVMWCVCVCVTPGASVWYLLFQLSVCSWGVHDQRAVSCCWIVFSLKRHPLAFLPQELLHSLQLAQSRLLSRRLSGRNIGTKRTPLPQVLCTPAAPSVPAPPSPSSSSGCFNSPTSPSATQSCHNPPHHHCTNSATHTHTHTQFCHLFPPFVLSHTSAEEQTQAVYPGSLSSA